MVSCTLALVVCSLVALYAQVTRDPDDGRSRLRPDGVVVEGMHQVRELVWSAARPLVLEALSRRGNLKRQQHGGY